MKNHKIEKEIKLIVSDISMALERVRSIAKYLRTEYIRDVIYGISGDNKKIRLRISDNFEYCSFDATHKYKVSLEEGVKKEVEEIIYKGNSLKEAEHMIKMQGDFKEENSYEKARVLFMSGDTEITLDIYPFGVWLEIEGDIAKIHHLAEKMGFSKKDYITDSADDIYLKWIKSNNLKEQWDVRFGLTGKK